MRTYTKDLKEIELIRIICNKCGKEICVEHGISKEGVFHGEVSWGFFSEKDGKKHSFDLCESCYDQWVRTFQIPVEIEEEIELI